MKRNKSNKKDYNKTSNTRSSKSKKNQKKLGFTKILLLSLVISAIIIASVYTLLNQYYDKIIRINREKVVNNITHSKDDKSQNHNKNSNEDTKPAMPEPQAKTTYNVLLLGTDQGGYLTDSMLLIHHNTISNSTSLISVPRDYKIDLSPEIQKEIKTSHKYIKLTELNSYAKMADAKSPPSYTTKAIEELTGLEIDYMVMFEIPAFKRLVDAVGGVEVYVPQNYHYDDPTQNLHIHLEKGTQLLNGKKAEGLVRFRQNNSSKGYGDFGRMEIQQYFFTAFVKKLVSLESILNIREIMDSIGEFIDTDASLNQAVEMLAIAKNADFNRVYSHTLPGKGRMFNNIYFYAHPEKEELHQIVKKWLEDDSVEQKSSNGFEIIVKNSGNSDAKSKQIVERLVEAGYNAKFGGSHDHYMVKSQIVVPEKGYGIDLKKFSSLAEIVVSQEAIKEDNTIYFIVGRIE